MNTVPTIRVLTLQQANKAGLKQAVTYRAKWPSQRWELESAVATLLAGNIAAAIVSGTEKHGIADVRRAPCAGEKDAAPALPADPHTERLA